LQTKNQKQIIMRKSFALFLIFFSISLFAQFPNTITPTEKLYGLSKFWQEVNYNFVYLDKVDAVEWDKQYKQLLGTITQTPNDYEYYRQLQKFGASLNDGHTLVIMPDDVVPNLMFDMFGDYRIFLQSIESKPIIIGSNLSKKDELPLGSEIIEVNGLPVQQYIDEKLAPYIEASTPYVRQNKSISNLFMGMEGDSYVIKIKKPNGKLATLNLTHKKTTEQEVYPGPNTTGIFEFKWLDKNIAYVGLNTFNDAVIVKQFLEKLPELNKAKALVIDIRYNGGGSSSNAKKIVQYFIDGNLIYGAKNSSRLHIPTDKALGSFLKPEDTIEGKKAWGLTRQETIDLYRAGKGNKFHEYEYAPDTISSDIKKIIIPTVILTGNATASSAEDFLVYADGQKHIKRIGESTNGSTGQPLLVDLPNGGSAWICTKKVTFRDGREFIGIGIKPDIEVKRTVSDFLKKKDPALEKAVQVLKTEIK